jgi:penicillin-binding protein 2
MAASDKMPETWRVWLVAGGMLIGMGILACTLWTTQILQGSTHESSLKRQSYLRVRLPGSRGRIMDRNGIPLVDNRPSYNIALFMDDLGVKSRNKELLPKVQQQVDLLKETMNIEVKVRDSAVKVHFDKRRPLPLTIWQDLTPATLAAFSERGPWNQGVKLIVEPVRQYTFGSLAAHILGHVGKPETSNQQDIGEYNYYQVDLIGKSGIEKDFDEYLRGEPGTVAQQLDAKRTKISEFVAKPAKSGGNVVLSIDHEIQMILETVFQTSGYNGAVIVVDPKNGDILGLLSWPEFDPNWFVPSITRDRWSALQTNPNQPLQNRAIQSTYSPGSTFKIAIALAALEKGIITPQTHFSCPGYFSLGNITFKCWDTAGHGSMDVRNAIRMSCNVFFYNTGNHFGPQNLSQSMIDFGFGQKTGVNLENENAGLVPTDAWQKKVTRGIQQKMSHGEAVNMAIGQGALNVTPIQMVMLYAAVANGGTLYKPRLVTRIEDHAGRVIKEFPPEARMQLPVSKENLKLVQDGMLAVVADGTGKRAQVPGVRIAGKTGSAQFKGIDRNTGVVVKRTRTWFDSFAPAESPRYAMVIMAEGGESGGGTCAPLASKIYEELFKLEKRREAGKSPTVVPAISVPGSEIPGDIGGEFMEAQPLSAEELQQIEDEPPTLEEENVSHTD